MFGRKLEFVIAVLFSVNLIFGLPVDKDQVTTTEKPSDDNNTSNETETHKEL